MRCKMSCFFVVYVNLTTVMCIYVFMYRMSNYLFMFLKLLIVILNSLL